MFNMNFINVTEVIEMTLIRYEIFRKVVETGSLTKAAEALNMTQSAISHALNNFEKEVGLPLLNRERSGVKLTTAGQALLPSILGVLNKDEEFKQTIAQLKGLEIGSLKIATFSSVGRFWLPQLLKEFQKGFPNVEVTLFSGYYHQIYDMIKKGQVDFAFLPEAVSEGVKFLPLKEDPMYVVIHQSNPLSQLDAIPVKALNNEAFIAPKWGLNHDVERIIHTHNLKLNIRYEIQEDQAIIAMVRQGLGLSILPSLTIGEVPEDVVKVPLKEGYQRTIGIGYTSTTLSPAATQFIELIQRWLAEHFI